MATKPKIQPALTLQEFLRDPEIDEQPYQEYIDGRIEVNVSPQRKHSPGFRLAVAEVFGWLRYRAQGPANPGADPR